MTRNPRQDRPCRVVTPIPKALLADAALIWWREFGPPGLRTRAPPVRAERGAVAVDGQGRVRGVVGLRDHGGGFPARVPVLARWLCRAAPPTADLVIDGIVALDRRAGIGRALVRAAAARARAGGHPGLRAEVRSSNPVAMGFWRAMGFAEEARGRYGWPWSGMVAVMRRDLDGL